MKHKLLSVAMLSTALALPAVALSQMKMEGHDMSGAGTKAGAAATMSDGEVRKVDRDANKITIKHGPISNLDMPAMTMVFQVKDPAMLGPIKAGDRIKFNAQKAGGQYMVTHIEPAK